MFGLAMPKSFIGATGRVGTRAAGRARRGFSLIELVIVVVIIGIIAAIAVPRMSRGSQGAGESALKGSLTVLRNAIDLYQTEHQAYPGTGTTYTTAADLERQLTKFTDGNGGSNGNGTKDSTHPYGPYLRRIPPMPVGTKKGTSTLKMAASDTEVPGTSTEAWIYYPTTGELKANLAPTELDGNDQPFSGY
jgi:prepilin-type N-terminal cleavage/methylation domain-containing protein